MRHLRHLDQMMSQTVMPSSWRLELVRFCLNPRSSIAVVSLRCDVYACVWPEQCASARTDRAAQG